jgi:hypothetical protein
MATVRLTFSFDPVDHAELLARLDAEENQSEAVREGLRLLYNEPSREEILKALDRIEEQLNELARLLDSFEGGTVLPHTEHNEEQVDTTGLQNMVDRWS